MRKDTLVDGFTEIFRSAIKEKLEKAESEEELAHIIDKINDLDIKNIFTSYLKDIAADSTKNLKETMHECVLQFRADEQAFIAHQEQKWCDAFVASEAMYIMVMEMSEIYREYVTSLDEEDIEPKAWEYNALLHIHGRALQQYLEIITLMKNGFADGAYARWRSMYELAVTASFIKKYGETVAKAFIEASETEDRYEWARASGAFKKTKSKIYFNDIKNTCGIDSSVWKEQYVLANRTVHASPQGTLKRLGNMANGANVIPTGRTDYGITTPAEHSAISLAQISSMFFTVFPNSEMVVAIKSLNDWIDVIRKVYFKTHDEVFPDDEPLWEEGMLDNK